MLDGDDSALEAVAASARAHHALLEVALCCDALATSSGRSGATQRAARWRAERDKIARSLAITAFSEPGGRIQTIG